VLLQRRGVGGGGCGSSSGDSGAGDPGDDDSSDSGVGLGRDGAAWGSVGAKGS
jgi:hypothetical protein